jgi:S-adenosyl methyltransferase
VRWLLLLGFVLGGLAALVLNGPGATQREGSTVTEGPRSQGPGSPSIQGVYDALRGGHRNLGADEEIAAALEQAFPGTGARMLEERAFTARAVTWAAGRGIRQYVVTGAGMPAAPGHNLHEAAQAARPGSVTVYASANPYAAAWTRALLAKDDPLVASVQAQVRCPSDILGLPGVAGLVDFGEPACVVAPMVLHFSAPDAAQVMISGIAKQLPAQSVVAVSAWARTAPAQAGEFERLFGHRIHRHAGADIAGWMTAAGLRVVPEPRGSRSGVVEARLWPDQVWAAGELGRTPGRIVVAVGVRE